MPNELALMPRAQAALPTDRRLIETWLPVAELGEESIRERRFALHGNALPPNYSLHVWWARRPLVASRAAILASVLPHDADRATFTHALGIHGDPIKVRRLLAEARRTGVRIDDPFHWPRAFRYRPSDAERAWISGYLHQATILDPTAGGGSIPLPMT